MTVIAASRYRNGLKAEETSLNEPIRCADDKSDFVWIGLLDPTEDELRTLQKNFHLHPLAVEDALKAHQLPKLDVYGDQLFVVMRTAHLLGEHIEYGETDIFVGSHFVISVRHGSTRAHTELRAHLEASPLLLRHGVDYVLHAILDYIVDGYLPFVQGIEDDVLQVEQRALDEFLTRAEVKRLFTLRHELIKFQRVLGPTSELVRKLVHLDLPCLDQDVRPYFSDVHDHVRRVESVVHGLRDIVTSVFEIGSLLEQQRQGAITRQLAAWAAILAVPTAIAGIYGMNFENMPELKAAYGYYIILAVIGLVCTSLYAKFKQIHWL